MNTRLLGLLVANSELPPVRFETIQQVYRLTPDRLTLELDRLKRAGCELDLSRAGEVKLVRSSIETWRDYLESLRTGRVAEVYRQVGSTQDAVKRMIEAKGDAAHGGVAVADEQTSGRGRLGRRWIAPPGTALTFSFAWLSEQGQSLSVDRLMMAAGVAIAKVVEGPSWAKLADVRIKWPNDVLVGGKKVAGILVETISPASAPGRAAAIIGVGINVSLPPESLGDAQLRERVTSLHLVGRTPDRLYLLEDALNRLEKALAGMDAAELLEEWRSRSSTIGQRARLVHRGKVYEGQVIDMDPNLGLILRNDAGSITHFPAATTSVL